jgi:hypothetical protein
MSTQDTPYARAFPPAAGRTTTPLAELIEHRVVASPPTWLSSGRPEPARTPLKAVPAPAPEPAPEPKAPPPPPPSPRPDPEVTRALADAVSRLNHVREQMLAEPEVVDLALVVAQEILRAELTVRPEHVLESVQYALQELRGDMPTRIRLAPLMVELLRDARPDLEGNGVELVADQTLGPGGCIVESRHRALDASVEERLERFRGIIHAALAGEGA